MVYACNGCDGRAITLSVLRKRADKTFMQDLWSAAQRATENGPRSCPSCKRKMGEVELARDDEALKLDVCPTCYVVWFDAGEVERVPRTSAAYAKETREMPREAQRALAMSRIQSIQAEHDVAEAKRELQEIRLLPSSRRYGSQLGLIESLAQLIVAVVRGFT